jgi:hypothetical protein
MPAKNLGRQSEKDKAKKDPTEKVAVRLWFEPEILETINKMFYWCDGKNGAACLVYWAVWMYLTKGRNPDEEMRDLPDGYDSPLKKIVERRRVARLTKLYNLPGAEEETPTN